MVAPDSSIKRPLRFWEQVCSFMGVSMGFELEGKINADIIKQAYALLQKEYPYLRCVLTQDANVLSFVERLPAPVSSRTSLTLELGHDDSSKKRCCIIAPVPDSLGLAEMVASNPNCRCHMQH
jgi:hypothetical protein